MATDDFTVIPKPDTARIAHPDLAPGSLAAYPSLEEPNSPGAVVAASMRSTLERLNGEYLLIDDAHKDFEAGQSQMTLSQLAAFKAANGRTHFVPVKYLDERGQTTYREVERPITDDAQAKEFIRALDGSVKLSGDLLLGTRNTIDEQIGTLEKKIESALTDPHANTALSVSLASEVRAHLFNAKGGERLGVAQRFLNSGDVRCISAMLGAPLALSGLSLEEHALLKAQAINKLAPLDGAQLEDVHKARKQLERCMNLLSERYKAARPMPSKAEAKKSESIARLAAGYVPKKEVA